MSRSKRPKLPDGCARIRGSNAGGIPEAVRDGINDLLVPPGDVAALRNAVAVVLRDAGLPRRLGLGGKELMRLEFAVDVKVEGNLTVYQALVTEPEREHA
jgi:glycosyltransferase involved in cell wall biosynthesis